MKSKWLISVGLVVCLLMAFALPMCAPAPAPPVEEEAPPEEEVISPFITIISCTTPGIIEARVKLCKEMTGVEVRWEFLSCGMINARLRAEAPRFTNDMMWAGCLREGWLVADNDWAVSYVSPPWAELPREWGTIDPAYFMGLEPEVYSMMTYGFCLVGNEDRINEAGYEMPTSWEDLLDPKWKGEIIAPSTLTSGTAYMFTYYMMTAFGFNRDKGEEGGWEFLQALDKNIHHYTRSGSAPTELIGRGEFMLAVTTDQNVLIVKEAGYPLVSIVPKEGIGYEPKHICIMKGTKRLAAAKKVLDWLPSYESLKLVADFGYVTRLPEAPSAHYGGIPLFVPNVDFRWALDNSGRLADEWANRIGRPAE